MSLDIFGEAVVGLLFLHLEHLGHAAVGGTKLQFPVNEAAVYFLPVVNGLAGVYLHGYVLEALAVSALRNLGHDFPAVNVLFQRKEYLVGVNRLDKVVGYLRAYGLIHDVFLLALSHHDNRRGRRYFLDLLQCLKTAKPWHHLVEQHKVERALPALVNGIDAVGYCNHVIAFLLKE